ncbi:hypothetical protein PG997_000350 [Apiospora hydei]|uniref:Uncharacterized protein n=1 Tax=Apiospora hydei TaxID=1337664 RepID=A0ABR1XAD2_9PEZI
MDYTLADEEATFENITITYCDNVGEAKPDIAGLGVLISFAGQALLSLFLAAWIIILSKKGHLHLHHHPEGSDEHERRKKRIEFLSDVVNIGNDLQVLLGIALMTNSHGTADHGLDQEERTGTVSPAPGIRHGELRWVDVPPVVSIPHHLRLRHLLHRARLNFRDPPVQVAREWQAGRLLQHGRRIVKVRIASRVGPGLRHDHGVVVTDWRRHGRVRWPQTSHGRPDLRHARVPGAPLLHDRHPPRQPALLEGTEDEDNWDFGQTTAMLLLGLAYLEFASKAVKYRKWTVQWKKNKDNLIPFLQQNSKE